MASMKGERARCVTGIEGLDGILGGGIPVSNMVLVAGGPGTGKTTLAYEFLVRGALKGEKGILVTTVESPEKLVANIPRFEFFDESLVKEGVLQILELGPLMEKAGIAQRVLDKEGCVRLGDVIEAIIANGRAKRIVIDSVNSPLYGVDDRSIGKVLLQRLSSAIYENECTGIVIADSPNVKGVQGVIADGLIVLGNHERRGEMLRTLQVVKMKGTSHSRSKYVIDLTSWGVLMTPLLKGGGVA